MALSKRKQDLINEMKKRGFSQKEIDWHLRKSSMKKMQTAIDNDRTHETITRLAAKSGEW